MTILSDNILFYNEDRSLSAAIPGKQLLDKSLSISAAGKKFTAWSEQNHADSYHFMQQIAQAWKNSHFTHQYLIYGKIDSNPFSWEIVPHQKCRTFIGRIAQQILVLWRTIFGGITAPKVSREKQFKNYERLFNNSPKVIEPEGLANKGTDSFCKNETIERQWVITGKKVNVLFNYAPIGFGGEKLHFLVVPKEHRKNFTDVTCEEYCESLALTSKLVDHFSKTRNSVKNVYLLNKTGIDAGQTVNHWHLHAIFSTNSAQDFWGKITVLKNILFGSSPMKKDDLEKKVKALREEFAV